jgi:hypothetical protein
VRVGSGHDASGRDSLRSDIAKATFTPGQVCYRSRPVRSGPARPARRPIHKQLGPSPQPPDGMVPDARRVATAPERVDPNPDRVFTGSDRVAPDPGRAAGSRRHADRNRTGSARVACGPSRTGRGQFAIRNGPGGVAGRPPSAAAGLIGTAAGGSRLPADRAAVESDPRGMATELPGGGRAPPGVWMGRAGTRRGPGRVRFG